MSVNDLYMILLNLIILINTNPIYQSSWYFYACYFKSRFQTIYSVLRLTCMIFSELQI